MARIRHHLLGVHAGVAGEAETTFAEIERRVPYLEWLGVDTLWLTPVLASLSGQKGEDAPGGPHGYDTIEYDRLAEDLGDREDLRSLVDTLHDHGIRLMFDLVLNHTSRNHPYFQMADAGVDPYVDYYEFVDGDAQFYFNWYNIPNLNYDEPAVREMVLSVVEEWAEYADGFRCDVAWALDPGFWQEARERARSVDPDIAMLGEVIPRDPEYHQTNFDLHYDTSLYGMLRGVGEGHEPASTVLDAVESDAAEGFPPRATQMRYVENHDEPRYLDSCDRASLKAAVGAICTLPDVPMLYAGQEMGMTEPREPLEWGGDDDLTRFHRRLLHTRNGSPVLTHGSFERIDHDPDSDHGVAFARDHEGERRVVVLNFGADPLDVWVDAALEPTDMVSGESVPVERHADGDGTTVTVDSVAVFETA
ncbi:alpha-amylase family glycosyl hydrolase [Halapricum sp. CBA1109]|uniref:alpha-amylase family glycosyl hydrolase n=1 Tax=Halapricum sp. CBA1109 TaxID=2668068 RepID=UPI00351B7899